MVIFDNHISPSVVCVINRQNIILKYGMRGHFRYTVIYIAYYKDLLYVSDIEIIYYVCAILIMIVYELSTFCDYL